MNTMNLLIIGTGTGNQFNSGNDWDITCVAAAEEAVEKMQSRDFDLIAVESSIAPQAMAMLQKIAALQQPDAVVVHYDGQGMLMDKAAVFLQNSKSEGQRSFSIRDNPFSAHPLYSNDNN